jgi:hypothetical protein
MASVSFGKLKSVITESTLYKGEIEKGVPIDQSLYISFAEPGCPLSTNVFSLPDGRELMLDMDDSGIVFGVEIH